MRILICHYNPEAPGKGGGAESAIRDQANALGKLGHEVIIEFAHPDKAYADTKPDLIHFHTIHVGLGLHWLIWAQKSGIPHCVSLHDYWPFCGPRMLLASHDKPCAAVKGLCDGQCEGKPAPAQVKEIVNGSPVVTFNMYSAQILSRHGVRVDAVISHGIDTDFFSPDYSQRDAKQIITTSAWPEYPTKGMHILTAALRELGIRGKLVSRVTRERVRDELRKAGIFVFPSCYEETWGLCLSEAMSCGLACIASDVCGPRAQITPEVNGLLVPPRDSHALAQAIKRLLEDAEMREGLAINARLWAVANLPLVRMARDYVSFYEEVLHGA